MSTLTENLSILEGIAKNPNLYGGVWSSLNLFLTTSAKLTVNTGDFDELSLPEEKKLALIKEIQDIRSDFYRICGVKDSANFERRKNSRCEGHRFKQLVSKFLQSYKGHFLIGEDKVN